MFDIKTLRKSNDPIFDDEALTHKSAYEAYKYIKKELSWKNTESVTLFMEGAEIEFSNLDDYYFWREMSSGKN